jgi:hypothetical protein
MYARLTASGPRAVILGGPQVARVGALPTPSIAAPRQVETIGTPPAVAGAAAPPTGEERVELYVQNTPPAAPTFPYLRVEVDGDGDPQRVLLGIG